MIDTNELRRQLVSTDIVDHIDLHKNIKSILSELLDRLEEAEEEKERLLGLAHDQNRELIRLREECRALRAPSINPASLYAAINWLRNGCDPSKAADELEMFAATLEG